MNHNYLVGFSLALVLVSVGSYAYYNTIPDDVIFVNESTNEILGLEEMQDKINPIMILMMGFSVGSLILFLVLKFDDYTVGRLIGVLVGLATIGIGVSELLNGYFGSSTMKISGGFIIIIVTFIIIRSLKRQNYRSGEEKEN